MELNLITVREFLADRNKYDDYDIYVHVGSRDKKSSSGTKITLEQLRKRNPNEIGWLDYYDDHDGYDEDGAIIRRLYSFNLGFNIWLERKIWKERKGAKK